MLQPMNSEEGNVWFPSENYNQGIVCGNEFELISIFLVHTGQAGTMVERFNFHG